MKKIKWQCNLLCSQRFKFSLEQLHHVIMRECIIFVLLNSQNLIDKKISCIINIFTHKYTEKIIAKNDWIIDFSC